MAPSARLFKIRGINPLSIAVIISIATALILRFIWVAQQGFVEFDEGWLVESATIMARQLEGGSKEIFADFKGSPLTVFIMAIPLVIFGDTPEAIMLSSATFGSLGALLVALLALKMYGRTVALVTLVIGAVSPLQILFSRTVALDVYGFFFLCLSYLLVQMGLGKQRADIKNLALFILSGLAISFALSCNYRALACIWLPSLVILVASTDSFIKRIYHIALHLLGFTFGLFSIDSLLKLFFPASRGYFNIFAAQYKHITSKTFGATSSSLIPSLHIQDGINLIHGLWNLDNQAAFVPLGLWALTIPLLLWRGDKRSSDLMLTIIIAIPCAMFSLLTVTAVRGLTVVQPLFAIAAARGLDTLSTRIFKGSDNLRNAALSVIVGVIVIVGLYRSVQGDVIARDNPFEAAFLQTCSKHRTGVITILDSGPEYYAKRAQCPQNIIPMGGGPLELLRIYLKGFRFWVIDAQLSAYMPRLFALWPSFDKRQPDIFVDAPGYVRLDHFIEHTVWSGSTYTSETAKYREWLSRWGARLPIFDLDNHIKPLRWQSGLRDWYTVGDAYVSLASSADTQGGYRIAFNPDLKSAGASATFNLHFNILPRKVGIGLCREGSIIGGCNGFGVTADLKPGYSEYKLLDINSENGASEIGVVNHDKLPRDTTTPLWIVCKEGELLAGLGGDTIFTKRLAGGPDTPKCASLYPSLIAKEGEVLESLNFGGYERPS
jgi:4-amino-4-deoxy-L-arabinose transferase-like glycosyltransferase